MAVSIMLAISLLVPIQTAAAAAALQGERAGGIVQFNDRLDGMASDRAAEAAGIDDAPLKNGRATADARQLFI